MKIYVADELLYSALCARLNDYPCTVTCKFDQYIDIAVATEPYFVLAYDVGAVLVDSTALPIFSGDGKVNIILSCGMSEKDTLTFSAIDGEKAAFCIQRKVNICGILTEIGEYPVSYDDGLPLWHNIVISFCEILLKELKRKEQP
jgi:hypothetical protein